MASLGCRDDCFQPFLYRFADLQWAPGNALRRISHLMLKLAVSRSVCWLLSLLIILPLNSCTTLQPVKGGSNNLPARIRAQKLISEGDRVEIRTVQNEAYIFKVSAVDDELVQGDAVTVRIDDIAELRLRRFNAQKTAGLAVVIVGLVVMAAIAINDSANNICSGGGCAPDTGL